MSTKNEEMALDAESIIKLISDMQPQAQNLFQSVLKDVLDRGNELSEVTVEELAKKYAAKALKLVG
ncbi:hypothetical protein D3OALGA1CA_5062 [Olavius algarvensis associated proteobacterium Delta 3]|nr:hypothetical protein D3OALGA1CA_5062 [Olavius algarvensis associated proteobacterium Delta 3]